MKRLMPYVASAKANIIIIASMDGLANSVRAEKIREYISCKGYEVDTINTLFLSRLSGKKESFSSKLPNLSFYGVMLYILEVLYLIITILLPKYKVYFGYFFITSMMKIRGKMLSRIIRNRAYRTVICISPLDCYCIKDIDKKCVTLFDCPTPIADEMYCNEMITKNECDRFKELEVQIYKSYDYLSFHWDTYAEYVKKHYGYYGANLIKLNWGTEKAKDNAKYNEKPRIIYFGNLIGNWVNFPLLSRLSKMYTIDVYGSPAPDPKYGLNYKGYATSDILSEYQFGLITISTDNLRKEGFSAKHLDYLSHGLPVLIPEWRESAKNLRGTILFNEENFLETIKRYSQQGQWDILSKDALSQSEEMRWENTLKSLDIVLWQ